MRLLDVELGTVFNGSGARSFFKEPQHTYWHTRFWQAILGKDLWFGSTFVAKTGTMDPWAGNTPFAAHSLRPRDWLPPTIKVRLLPGRVLNAVGLSNPSHQALLDYGLWQRYSTPFVISFMTIRRTRAERLDEVRRFGELYKQRLNDFATSIVVEWNRSCPNVDHDQLELIEESNEGHDILKEFLPHVPKIDKVSVVLPLERIAEISRHPDCHAIHLSNTIPFGMLPDKVDWKRLYPSGSPLAHLGGGGLSGPDLFEIVGERIYTLRHKYGVTTPLIAGGGICTSRDAIRMLNSGADAISIATVSMVRPWRVPAIIQAANAYRR